jgi:PleD family two-component response regulator
MCQQFPVAGQISALITCSAGVCRWDGEESAEKLTARADTALYAAKDAGRDQVTTA